jgi:L-lactate utilization protein LutB
MEHDTKLPEQQMMQEQMKKMFEAFAKLPKERQAEIIKRVGEGVAAQVKKIGQEFVDELPNILAELQELMTEPKE